MLSRTSGIYKITSIINGKIYIGSASCLSTRKSRHFKELRENKHHSIILQNSFNKYGESNFKFEIIELVPNKLNLITREQHYIDTLKPEFNICKIAGSCLGIKQSEETIEKRSSKLRGRTVVWGKGIRENSIIKLKKTIQDNPSISLKNKESKYKPVIQLDLQGNFIKEWNSAKLASEDLKISSSNIGSVCLGKQQSSAGFLWLFKEDFIKNKSIALDRFNEKYKNNLRPVIKLTLAGEFVFEYPSVKEASKSLNVSPMLIINVCKNKPKSKTAKGFKFLYKENYVSL